MCLVAVAAGRGAGAPDSRRRPGGGGEELLVGVVSVRRSLEKPRCNFWGALWSTYTRWAGGCLATAHRRTGYIMTLGDPLPTLSLPLPLK